jgi:hypothetical protein
VKSRHSIRVGGVDIGAAVEELLQAARPPVPRQNGQVQREHTGLARRHIGLGTCSDQRPDASRIALEHRVVQTAQTILVGRSQRSQQHLAQLQQL